MAHIIVMGVADKNEMNFQVMNAVVRMRRAGRVLESAFRNLKRGLFMVALERQVSWTQLIGGKSWFPRGVAKGI